MSNAGIDQNSRQTLTALANDGSGTIVQLWADPITHRLLVDTVAGSGTVTSVSVVSANGFAGTVATATTTPAITLTTTITGILQGNGTAISAATTTGSGSVVLATSPTLVTPVLGAATGTSLQLSGLTASQAVVTDGSKNLASLGYSTAATASNLVERDANANTKANIAYVNTTSVTSAGGTTVLTAGSSSVQILTGSSSQTFQLPDATTLALGPIFTFNNNSSGSLIINNAGSTALYTIPAGGEVTVSCTSISTANGAWDIHPRAPITVTWGSGTTGMVFNTALTTTPAISAGISSAANPSFIPQRGNPTNGYGGDGLNLYGSIGGSAVFTATSTNFTVPALNKVAITAPATSATLTIADGKTFTANNSITLAGTDSTTITFQGTDTYVGRTTTDTLTNKTLTTPAIASIKGTLTTDTDGATITFDKNVSDFHNVVLGGNRTLALSNMAAGDRIVLRLVQDATGTRTVTWFTTIKWAGGSAPTLTTTINKADVFGFLCTSAGNYDGFVIGQNI